MWGQSAPPKRGSAGPRRSSARSSSSAVSHIQTRQAAGADGVAGSNANSTSAPVDSGIGEYRVRLEADEARFVPVSAVVLAVVPDNLNRLAVGMAVDSHLNRFQWIDLADPEDARCDFEGDLPRDEQPCVVRASGTDAREPCGVQGPERRHVFVQPICNVAHTLSPSSRTSVVRRQGYLSLRPPPLVQSRTLSWRAET